MVTPEEDRTVSELRNGFSDKNNKEKENQREIVSWDVCNGITLWTPDGTRQDIRVGPNVAVLPGVVMTHDVNLLWKHIRERCSTKDPIPTLYIVCDMQYSIEQVPVIRNIQMLGPYLKRSGSTLIFLSAGSRIPLALQKLFQVVEYPYPTFDELSNIFDEHVAMVGRAREKKRMAAVKCEDSIKYTSAINMQGLTFEQAEDVLALAAVKERLEFTSQYPSIIQHEKMQKIKATGLITPIIPRISFSDLGGMGDMYKWFNLRFRAYDPAARDFGLKLPKSVLLGGPPGVGKSVTAEACAIALKRELLYIDMGSLYEPNVGKSEENVRTLVKLIASFGDCVVLFDEVEKTFGKAAVSGVGDSGVSSRIFATLLTWMTQECRAFMLWTCNDASKLPPELIRPGRFDKLFWIDVPEAKDRENIFRIHLCKRKRSPEDFNLKRLVKQSDSFTGAEIEQAVEDALFIAYSNNRELIQADLELAVSEINPIAKTCEKQLDEQRAFAAGRFKSASGRSLLNTITEQQQN